MEAFASLAITAGGVGTILAVGMIFVFLLWVVAPLFGGPEVGAGQHTQVDRLAAPPLRVGADAERLLAWSLLDDGSLELHSLVTGERIDLRRPFGERRLTAASFSLSGGSAVFGFADGTACVGRFSFETEFLREEEAPQGLRDLSVGDSRVHDGGVAARTSIGQLRHTTLALELESPMEAGDPSAVSLVDHAQAPAGLTLVTLQASGALRVSRERQKRNLLTGEVTRSLKHAELVQPRAESSTGAAAGSSGAKPVAVRMGGLGQHVYVLHPDGSTQHWDLRDFSQPRLFEELDLVEDPEAELTCAEFVGGRQTLVIGDSKGRLRTWFPARPEGEGDADPLLRLVHDLDPGDAPVVAIAASPRSRLVAAAFASGVVHLYQTTLGKKLLTFQDDAPAQALTVPPKEDAVLVRGANRFATWTIDTKYPEASLTALFTPLWYEGYPGPSHVWQSSSASDDFETKLGLMPLVFGTLKATLYSMLFGAPLAILAALYTSEFLAPRLRSSVKSTVELMASLPSVVLGFIAALVIAPFVQAVLPAVMAALLTLPLATLSGAFLWQLLPNHLALRWAGWQRFVAILLTLPIGVLAAVILGPFFERLVFAGDVSSWLAGQHGAAWGGWFLLLLPAAALAATVLATTVLNPWVRARSHAWERGRVARVESLKYLGGVLLTLGGAALIASALQGLGFDPRGGVIDTYVQRNALIVGFVMGFAIVPIIYTLAEDALAEVPSALREGSLGAGATPWQTAVRIVVPFAMSGIFSALMIGLGRAVGETMIVLMAAGNTPIMEWNIFNGFRTLSANVAVELPEAVVGSAHYRTLFLAALVLFVLTFLLNTVAELVRRHFRSRFQGL